MKRYTAEEMNAAIARVETAKQNHPVGWRFLETLHLPSNDLTAYAYVNADLHAERLVDESARVVYAAAWLNGVAIGVALGEARSLTV